MLFLVLEEGSQMAIDVESIAIKPASSTMEDFGRFNPVETLDSDHEITDESLDVLYGEENGGA